MPILNPNLNSLNNSSIEGVVGVGSDESASEKDTDELNDDLKFGGETKSQTKLANEMAKRGWTKKDVQGTVDNPHTTRDSTNKANGNDATAYYNEDGSYVVVDDETNEVIQVSDKNDPNWIPDSSIENPYFPE